MDYLNCKDLPVWAQILVGLEPEPTDEAERKQQEEREIAASRAAHAA